MKKTIYLLFILILGALTIAACVMEIPATQDNGTPQPTHENPMDLVQKLATGTAAAKTEMAKPENAPIAQTATAFALTRQTLSLALVVVLPDGSRQDFTYSELENRAALTVDFFDAPRKAVDLRFLLDEAGWHRFPLFSVTIEGRNSTTFHVDRLPKDAALYLNEGRVNFVSREIPSENWPYDVVLIIVR